MVPRPRSLIILLEGILRVLPVVPFILLSLAIGLLTPRLHLGTHLRQRRPPLGTHLTLRRLLLVIRLLLRPQPDLRLLVRHLHLRIQIRTFIRHLRLDLGTLRPLRLPSRAILPSPAIPRARACHQLLNHRPCPQPLNLQLGLHLPCR